MKAEGSTVRSSWIILASMTVYSLAAISAPSHARKRDPHRVAESMVRASEVGAALDTDLMKGGGTDDTAVLQAVLDRASRETPLHFIIDGPSLIAGLSIRSFTTLECTKGGGFFLKENSNRDVLRNANRSRERIIDHNIRLKRCFINGNRGKQTSSSFSDGYSHPTSRSADRSFKSGIQFLGVDHLSIEDVTIYDARAFGALVSNAAFVEFKNVTVDFSWPKWPVNDKRELVAFAEKHFSQNDGLHFVGPVRHLRIDGANLKSSDDAIALNANDGRADDMTVTNEFGPYVGQGPITDVVIRNVKFNDASHGIRLLSRNQRIDRILISDIAGTVYWRFIVISGWISGPGTGDVGSVTLRNVNVYPIRSPNTYELCSVDRCGVGNIAPAEARFIEEDAESPIFSLNTQVESLTFEKIFVRASDPRPILRIGAYADIVSLKMDILVEDPSHQANPLILAPGGMVNRFEYSLTWQPRTVVPTKLDKDESR